MDIDIEKLVKTATESLNLKDFKGDVVAVKVVENEIGNIEEGGIGVQKNYYSSEGAEKKGDGEKHAFGFVIHSHHSQKDIDAALESLAIKCQGTNSNSLARQLFDMERDKYIDISDVSASELYKELDRVYGLPNIKQRTFAESYRNTR